MNAESQARLHRAVTLYNRGRYLDSQEPFEELYRSVDATERPLIDALLALACGMHLHFHRGGGRGVLNLCRRCLVGLDGFPPCHAGVEVEDLAAAVSAYIEELRGRRRPEATFLDRWLAPRITLRDGE